MFIYEYCINIRNKIICFLIRTSLSIWQVLQHMCGVLGVLYVWHMCITCVSATHVLHLYSTHVIHTSHYTCIFTYLIHV